ncbi:ABC transporter [Ordospora pajunii]|uniref:ABC transporter n=1 Tax=Ordospora pajunii TaxID=3039483 RepID=UPI0029526728|nr:ABC transporter [Ordospora pajunii]KAH9411648.1 ABC transporter [Ordospora pajunii]
MKESVKNTGRLYVMKTVVLKYVLGSPVVRVMILPVVLLMLVVAYGDITVQQILTDIQDETKDPHSSNNQNIKDYVLVALSSYVFGFVSLMIMSSYVETICRVYIVDQYRDHISMSFPDFKRLGVGNMISFMNRKVGSLRDVLESIVKYFIIGMCYITMTMTKIGSELEWYYMALMAAVSVIYGVSAFFVNYYRSIIRPKLNREVDLSRRKVYNNLMNHDIIKSYNNEEEEANDLHRSMEMMTKYAKIFWGSLQVGNFVGESIFTIAMFAITMYFTKGDTSRIKSKDYMLMISLSNQLRIYCVDISNSFGSILMNLTNIAQTRNEEERPDMQDYGCYKDRLETSIKIADASVCVEGKRLVEGLNMEIRMGEKIGITGGNGSGKTSFVRALLGFFDYSGTIVVDGVELRTLSKKGLRRMISYSPQELQLFDDTVMNNINDGNLKMCREEIVECCKMYGVDEMFQSLDKGYDTLVGMGGKRLSGGQKQRVSLMRAVVKDASVYVFDQVTSHLDKETEMYLVDMIMKNLADKTVIMIMQNANMFEKFDRIYRFLSPEGH